MDLCATSLPRLSNNVAMFNRRKTNTFRAILHTYISIYIRTYAFLLRPATVRRTVVICRVRACENTTEEYFTFRSVHAPRRQRRGATSRGIHFEIRIPVRPGSGE